MSLGSLVTNLFCASTPTPKSQQQDRNEFTFADDGLSAGKQDFADANVRSGRFRTETMAPKEDEEEGRPPYLHVRGNCREGKINC